MMDISNFIAITPQLVIATGIVFALLLVAWRRSQHLICAFTLLVIILTLIATLNSIGSGSYFVTALLHVDDYSRYGLLLVLIAGLSSVLLSHQELSKQVEVHDEFYLLVLLTLLGAGVLVASHHFASLFLGFELLSISLVGLVGYFRQENNSVETGFKYLILSASASSFMLLGIAFIYAQTGQMSFSYAGAETGGLFQLGFILFFSGVAFKLSLVPFHYWTPDVYQGSSTPVTLLLATVSKCAMFIVLLKSCFSSSDVILSSSNGLFQYVSAIAILSMIAGNSLALKQQSIKRLLAYSSIAHMGYLAIVVMLSQPLGLASAWQSALFYLTAYLLANMSIFTVLAITESGAAKGEFVLANWRGLFWRSPWLALLVIVSILSFAGIPLTAGFIGKFYLVSFAAEQALWGLLTALIVGSGISLAYYLPVIFVLFSEQEPAEESVPAGMSLVNKSMVLTFIGAGLLLGILPDVIGTVLQQF